MHDYHTKWPHRYELLQTQPRRGKVNCSNTDVAAMETGRGTRAVNSDTCAVPPEQAPLCCPAQRLEPVQAE
jgi:hypothetical protein